MYRRERAADRLTLSQMEWDRKPRSNPHKHSLVTCSKGAKAIQERAVLQQTVLRELPGGLVARILGFHCQGPGSMPGQVGHGQKQKQHSAEATGHPLQRTNLNLHTIPYMKLKLKMVLSLNIKY